MLVTSGEAGIDSMAPDEARVGAARPRSGRAGHRRRLRDRVPRPSRRSRRRGPRAAPRHRRGDPPPAARRRRRPVPRRAWGERARSRLEQRRPPRRRAGDDGCRRPTPPTAGSSRTSTRAVGRRRSGSPWPVDPSIAHRTPSTSAASATSTCARWSPTSSTCGARRRRPGGLRDERARRPRPRPWPRASAVAAAWRSRSWPARGPEPVRLTPVRPRAWCGPITICSSTPRPTRSPHVAFITCCTCRWWKSVSSISSVFSASPPTTSSSCQRPWPHVGWRVADAAHAERQLRVEGDVLGLARRRRGGSRSSPRRDRRRPGSQSMPRRTSWTCSKRVSGTDRRRRRGRSRAARPRPRTTARRRRPRTRCGGRRRRGS